MIAVFYYFIILSFGVQIYGKFHHLSLTDELRRNILLTSFGYNVNGSFELNLSNFTIPREFMDRETSTKPNIHGSGVVGFTLSRGADIVDSIRSAPHFCQLSQIDQDFDAIFFVFNTSREAFDIIRRGAIGVLQICSNLKSCVTKQSAFDAESTGKGRNWLDGLLKEFFKSSSEVMYRDLWPLQLEDGRFSGSMAVRFTEGLEGRYHFAYHNCFNYQAYGLRNRVATNFTIDIVERNTNSYLSAGDIFKPKLFSIMSAFFMIAAFIWTQIICASSRAIVYQIHFLMAALVFIKSLSLFFHGINYYFVSLYGQQREAWAIIFYITHLFKGALLFGTILLIGTGYTFFKNFLTDRDRRLFMIVLPLQNFMHAHGFMFLLFLISYIWLRNFLEEINEPCPDKNLHDYVLDNIAMVIIEEIEFGQQGYQFWFQLFILFDIICCLYVLLPIVWSMKHLQEGATTDGKAAFNLEKLRLFRHFYLIVIGYIYITRFARFLFEFISPYNSDWFSDAIVEMATLFFFILTGYKFRPQEQNPYLKLKMEDCDPEAITQSGIFANVTRVKRSVLHDDELYDIPGTFGKHESDSEEDGLFSANDYKPLLHHDTSV